MDVNIESPYEALAEIFDIIAVGDAGMRVAGLAEQLAAPAWALDLGSATGRASIALAQRGVRVVGIDCSPAMLRIARSRARDAGVESTFIEGDIRRLGELVGGRLFDLVMCTGDTIGEIVEPHDLDSILRQCRACMTPGGALVFDARRRALVERWDARDEVLHDGDGVLAYVHRDFQSHSAEAASRFVWFVNDTERWWRDECELDSRLWSDDELLMALEQAGFGLEARLSLDGSPADAEEPWVVFVARPV